MRQFFQSILRKPVLWLTGQFDSKPDKERIYNALSKLFSSIIENPGKNGLVIPLTEHSGKFIIFSDQHKGRRNGADDFASAETNYLEALNYYYENDFCFINLGDCEELWENTLQQIRKANTRVFEAEKVFLLKNAFIKIFGNHDLYWANDPLSGMELETVYGVKLKAYEAVILTTSVEDKKLHIFCTHGHQGDKRSDGNWLTKFFISRIWAPLQAFLKINPNEPSNDDYKKTIHNEIMYEWSATQPQTILITGHTHQPVFESLTHIERLHRKMQIAKKNADADTIQKINLEIKIYQQRFDAITYDYSTVLPHYYNTGCCCFSDGDITGIEIETEVIRLIKWEQQEEKSTRIVLEQKALSELV